MSKTAAVNVRKRLRLDPAAISVYVGESGADATPGVKGRKAAAKDLAKLGPKLAELQEKLYAEGRVGGNRRVVLLLQGTDSSGKDGTVKHVVGLVNPSGVKITSFGPPTDEERKHPFLWRVTKALPGPGYLGVFNRSQYEDVLIVRVHDLVPPAEWEKRYDLINAWEAKQVAAGVTFVKVFLHISKEEQRRRLLARLEDVRKHWKVNPSDIEERALWESYRVAYGAMLERCSTDVAPWYVVPADHKWYRNWAVTHLLTETLEELDPQWPVRPDLDIPGMIKALQEG
ncbi:MAG: UDP-galactose-lipid carrier transferase [Frankiales bacterium]|jgi:PPK2 family polyphosphate:nucleotide phosphotransferase|nr:UDP-galactose-lipid carrier transferase [Frankiales bacterium]